MPLSLTVGDRTFVEGSMYHFLSSGSKHVGDTDMLVLLGEGSTSLPVEGLCKIQVSDWDRGLKGYVVASTTEVTYPYLDISYPFFHEYKIRKIPVRCLRRFMSYEHVYRELIEEHKAFIEKVCV